MWIEQVSVGRAGQCVARAGQCVARAGQCVARAGVFTDVGCYRYLPMLATIGIYRCRLLHVLPLFTDVGYYWYLPISATTGIY